MISIHPSRCSQWLWENVRQSLLKVKCQNCMGVNWKIESKVDIVFKSHEVWERWWKDEAHVSHLPEVSVCVISFSSVSGFTRVNQTTVVWFTSTASPVTDSWRKCLSIVAQFTLLKEDFVYYKSAMKHKFCHIVTFSLHTMETPQARLQVIAK